MGYEYKQVRYRTTEGKFDGSLNDMARQGWRVVSINPSGDEIVLATFERHVTEPTNIAYVATYQPDFEVKLKELRAEGYRVAAMSTEITGGLRVPFVCAVFERVQG